MLRPLMVRLHRWAGLIIAGFLVVAGLTGAVISWDHELDGVLNPHLTEARADRLVVDPFAVAKRIETDDPRARVTYLPLSVEPGHSLSVFVSPRIDPATHDHFELGYNQVFVDPVSGEELGRREWGAVWPISGETFVSFLYVLHYSLHIPEMWGIDEWGLWLMGAVAIVWMLDAFVGFYLTLPKRREQRDGRPAAVERVLSQGWRTRWAPAWKIKSGGSRYRVTFDLHRALGLWTWGLLFLLAFTAFSLSLYREIFYPLMSVISEVTPTPFDSREAADDHRQIEPKIDYRGIAVRAAAEGDARGIREPVGAVFYSAEIGVYGAKYFHPGDDHGAAGVGPAEIYFDALDGRVIGDRMPWSGTLADIFVQAQFPLHSGRILGLPGRILVSIMGLVVAAVSITGVLIYLRKQKARCALDSTGQPAWALRFWRHGAAWGGRIAAAAGVAAAVVGPPLGAAASAAKAVLGPPLRALTRLVIGYAAPVVATVLSYAIAVLVWAAVMAVELWPHLGRALRDAAAQARPLGHALWAKAVASSTRARDRIATSMTEAMRQLTLIR